MFLASYLRWHYYYGGFLLRQCLVVFGVFLFLLFGDFGGVCVLSLCFLVGCELWRNGDIWCKGGDSEKMEKRIIAKFFF